MKRLADVDIKIHNESKHDATTVRELQPGDWYITASHYRKMARGAKLHLRDLRSRTEDPFRSMTFMETPIATTPSTKVYKVTIIKEGANV